MTKLIKYVLIAAATAFASCVNDSDMDECGENFSPAQPVGTFYADGRLSNSDVEIRLSAGSGIILDTRAPIAESGAEFSASDIGIFCLATSHLNSRSEEFPIDWSREAEDAWSVWIDNAKSKADKGNIYISTETEGEEKVYYYPNGNLHRYSFYGYYPRKDTKIEYCKDKITASINLDGTQDIMWGKSQPDNTSYGNYRASYSAMYFHKATNPQTPTIEKFSHKMMLMNFTISSVVKEETDNSDKQFELKSIELLDMPETATLIIADLDDPTTEGTVDYGGAATTYILRDKGDDPLQPVLITGDKQPVGQGICLPPVDGGEVNVKISLQNVGTGKVYIKTKTLSASDFSIEDNEDQTRAENFEPGHKYTVNILVNEVGGITVNGK